MIATFADNTLTLSAGGYARVITVREIASTWDALSHFPERRARLELEGVAETVKAFGDRLEVIAAAGGAIDTGAELEQFTRRHVELVRRAWALESRCMSWFIVGPSKFPTRSNEKRQNSRDKAYAAIRDHVAAARKAVERRAWPHGAPGSPIRANNPDAPELLRQEIDKLARRRELMKAANAAIRSTRSAEPGAIVQAVVDATGWPHTLAAKLVEPDYCGRRGFADFEFSNSLAELKRLEGRLAAIEATRARGDRAQSHNTTAGAVEVVENAAAARIQLVFPGKPEAHIRALLKGRGFRWAPSEGAWQRHLNANGRYAAQQVIAALQVDPGGAP